jgi:hypothetical protein
VRTFSTYRKSGRLFILRVMAWLQQLHGFSCDHLVSIEWPTNRKSVVTLPGIPEPPSNSRQTGKIGELARQVRNCTTDCSLRTEDENRAFELLIDGGGTASEDYARTDADAVS